jgi:hypothetical protein
MHTRPQNPIAELHSHDSGWIRTVRGFKYRKPSSEDGKLNDDRIGHGEGNSEPPEDQNAVATGLTQNSSPLNNSRALRNLTVILKKFS